MTRVESRRQRCDRRKRHSLPVRLRPRNPYPAWTGNLRANNVPHDSTLLDKEVGTQFVQDTLLKAQRLNARKARRRPVIVFVDIDDLTQINKHYGRKVGDEVLRQAIQLIAAQCANPCGRCGDDTFYAYLPKTADNEGARVSEEIRRAVEGWQWQGVAPELHVTCTCGYALLHAWEYPVDWVRRAILGMLDGKKLGGNKVVAAPFSAGRRTLGLRPLSDLLRSDVPKEKLSLRDYFS